MIAKVVLGTMQNARKLVSIVEAIPYDAELCAGRYVVNAKSMLGVLSMPDFETANFMFIQIMLRNVKRFCLNC